MPKGRYYLGRVIKSGLLDADKLIDAIVQSKALTIRKFTWIFTDVVDGRSDSLPFVYAKLSKYSREGQVTIVDPDAKSQIDALAQNLLVASSPFVYLPTFSGIAYLHIWNEIQEELFERRFKILIESVYENFFVDCQIEPVSDYRAFTTKVRELDRITEIAAKIHPPNPLFGRIWGPLKEYVQKRNASEASFKEQQDGGTGLRTNIVPLMEGILENPKFEPAEEVDITDAALLMAADGYGLGKVSGDKEGEEVVIRTSDTQKSFLFDKEPTAEALAYEAAAYFRETSEERDMRH
jgi:hypothetical protein